MLDLLLALARQPPADDVRDAADEILRGEAYQPVPKSLVERVLDRIFEFLADSFARITGSGAGSVIGLAVVGLLVAGAGYFVFRTAGMGWSRVRVVGPEPVLQGTDAPVSPETWLEEAAACERRGDLRGALRCRYQAFAATAVRNRVVADVAGRTAAELATELRGRLPDDDHATLVELTRTFERAWYGGESVDGDDLASFRGAIEPLTRSLQAVPA